MTDKKVFRIRTYGWQELAILYYPHVKPESATRHLRRLLNKQPQLIQELSAKGWRSGQRVLTPAQVQLLVNYWGEP